MLLGAGIILLNGFFYIPMSYNIIITDGGDMGLGLFILPFTLFFHTWLIPAILVFTNYENVSIKNVLTPLFTIAIVYSLLVCINYYYAAIPILIVNIIFILAFALFKIHAKIGLAKALLFSNVFGLLLMVLLMLNL